MHTPGPWNEHGRGGCPCGQIFGPDGNVLIATVYGPSHLDDIEGPDCVPSESHQQANAHLIAAAPDMLASAIEIDRLTLVIESAVRNFDPRNYAAVLSALRANIAAIKSAKGES